MSAFPGPRPNNAFVTPTKLRDVQQVREHIQLAIDKAFDPHPSVYKEVTALLMHFTNDDLGVTDLEDELALTFRNFYGFRVKQIFLNANRGKAPGHFLIEQFTDMANNNLLDKNCLLIVVFSGHGELKFEYWPPNRQIPELHVGGAVDKTGALKGRTLRWRFALDWLQETEADIVQILDCCYAAEAAAPPFEMLAATSGTEIAASSLKTCFTQGLITELKRHASSPITVNGLQKAMMDNRKSLGLEHTPTYDPRPEALPSILFTPRVSHMPESSTIISGKAGSTRAMITAHLSGDLTMTDIDELKRWLSSRVPLVVRNIDFWLDGFHMSGSTILTISLPIELWTQFPADTAYAFVAFVDSPNMLLA